MKFCRQLLDALHKLYLVRFPVIAGLLLFTLPFVEFQDGVLEALFGGLLDLTTWQETFWATAVAYLLAWSAIIAFRITMLYGPERVGMPKSQEDRFIETRLGAQLMFGIGFVLPLPLLIVVGGWHYSGPGQIGGIVLGCAAALVIVYLVDLAQRAFNTFRGDPAGETAKQMFFPFDSWLARKAEESDKLRSFFAKPGFDWLSRILARVGREHGVGYFKRSSSGVVVNPGIVLAVGMFIVYLGIYLVGFYRWNQEIAQAGPPNDIGIRAIVYFLVVVTLVCWLLSGMAFHLDRHRIPTLLLIVLILMIPDLRHSYDVTRLAAEPALKFATPKDVLETRKNQRYIIFVTANGGGIQSSAWATEVLTRFDENCRAIDPDPNGCRNAIAVMSGISGGSVGVMYFAGAFNGPKTFDPEQAKRIRDYSRESSLVNVAGGLVFNDFVRNIPFASMFMTNDRAKHLAQGWADNRNKVECDFQRKLDPKADCKMTDIGPLSSWRSGVSEGERPAVIFNATAIEPGQRVLFSTADFHPQNPDFADWTTLQKLGGPDADLRVTEAVRLSAGFPFVSPAAKMYFPDTNEGRFPPSLADGGYYDNYGLLSIRDFLDVAINNGAWQEFDGPRPKVLIIQIYGEKPLRDAAGERTGATYDFMSWFDQILSPVTALVRVRSTSQYDRNEAAYREIVQTVWDLGLGEPERFIFEFPDNADRSRPVPLSWHLTQDQKDSIEKAGIDAFGNNEGVCRRSTPWLCLRRSLADATAPR